MLFNSLEYALFLPTVFALFWFLPKKFRCIWLLLTSYFFYMSWNVKYVSLILGTTFISYVCALIIYNTNSVLKKKFVLCISALSCLSVLAFFKYFNFLFQELVTIVGFFSIKIEPIVLNILLPVGISFYTFQTLSYVIDVYKGKVEPEKSFITYATFVSFFPQLVAGPIERASNLLPQIKNIESVRFDYDKATYGVKLITWGLFKKLVIADVLAVYVDKVYDAPTSFTGFALLLAMFFFTIQIYCDFSGYSDIAVGSAKLIGIDLMTNFKSPYFSQSLKEFWSRWHISLSTWFKDYFYIPLGGNRCSNVRHCINLLLTFLLSGLWHGANITFVIWGGIHGLILVAESQLSKVLTIGEFRGSNILKNVFTFLIVMVAWNFFRAESVNEALYICKNAMNGINDLSRYVYQGFYDVGLGKGTGNKVLYSVVLLCMFDYYSKTKDVILWLSNQKFIVRHSVYLFVLLIILLWRASLDATFVYFQF